MDSDDGPFALAWSGMPRRLLNIFALVLLVRFVVFLCNGDRVQMRFRQLQNEGIVSSRAYLHSISGQREY